MTEPPDSAPLQYEKGAAAGSSRWALASVVLSAAALVLVYGSLVLSQLRYRGRLNDAPAALYLATSFGFFVVPPVGIVFGALGLRRGMPRRWLAGSGVLLNLSVWLIFLAVLVRHAVRTGRLPGL